eukprot:365595-Chlamydomonas_euryale.AAC.4
MLNCAQALVYLALEACQAAWAEGQARAALADGDAEGALASAATALAAAEKLLDPLQQQVSDLYPFRRDYLQGLGTLGAGVERERCQEGVLEGKKSGRAQRKEEVWGGDQKGRAGGGGEELHAGWYVHVDGWMHGWVDVWMDVWMDGCMGAWMDEWMDGCVDGWMDGCMDG